ncbi:glycosyltransferase family 4 protein [Saccharicrinis fermentans]|uniref:GDP-mannose-dependent alpha-(1-6)-phosphatidylinositol monomannoside mannosyltransferase n=1 Tax=Saccharicrinis fermentans DSM 9555 = JCM 21142 TaxID=869213 RepID=W7XUV0_9BACT|nr:glycosyltransferase family 4 protein [Saccharicrinis fermentans]GAF01815.1 GDP-mannose-dependent alpha-(1-6)-phosphatidylinositol monomannoside mannosyltransferase [Saccharicrinis fermentans DSM 9555 = JCM 21142]
MRICITRTAKKAYSETFIHDQITQFSKLADIYTIYRGIYPERKEDGSLLSPKPLWIMHKIVKVFVGRNNFFGNYGVKKYLQENKIDTVFANYGMSGSYMVPVCKTLNIPLIVIFHGYDATENKIIRKFRKKYHKLFDYASSIIAVSEEMKKKLIALDANPSKIKVIPYGVDISKFKPNNEIITQKKFLAVGRLTAKKAPLTTISAFSKVLKKFPDATLTIVGKKTGLFEKCEQLVQELKIKDSVIFTGALPHHEIAALMRSSLAFVQHSITAHNGDMEGTPLGILEASATGLPVVSTLHGGIKEAIIHNKTGYLIEENDEDSMAKYMIEICKNPIQAKEMGRNGRLHIEKNYNQPVQIKKIYDIILNNYQSNK